MCEKVAHVQMIIDNENAPLADADDTTSTMRRHAATERAAAAAVQADYT